jgi:hypothetical protein
MFANPKWADYVITAVGYDMWNQHIERLAVREDKIEYISDATIWMGSSVVSAINNGSTFVTAVMQDGKWFKGEDVRVVYSGGKYYLRTDNNGIAQDNLGDLPRL